MKYQHPLVKGRLLRRYKRFLADVDLGSETITAHCPNPGSLLGLNIEGAGVWLSRSANVKRKLPYTLELIESIGESGSPCLSGINAGLANRLVEEGIVGGVVEPLQGYDRIRREVRYGKNSRIDFLLESHERAPCYVEVKNAHLSRAPGLAEFPDSVTARGAKHLRELSEAAQAGARCVTVYCVQRGDCDAFGIAGDIDPAYLRAFREAALAGVETFIYKCHISPEEISIAQRIAFAGAPGGALSSRKMTNSN